MHTISACLSAKSLTSTGKAKHIQQTFVGRKLGVPGGTTQGTQPRLCAKPTYMQIRSPTGSAACLQLILRGQRSLLSSLSTAAVSSGVVTKWCPHMRGHARFSTTYFVFHHWTASWCTKVVLLHTGPIDEHANYKCNLLNFNMQNALVLQYR